MTTDENRCAFPSDAVEAASKTMIKCPNCGRENADNFNFCLDCGYDLKAYREAFPDGVPSAPPPPMPAVTATNMHAPSMDEISQPSHPPVSTPPPMPHANPGFGLPPLPPAPIGIPHTLTPQAVQSPLPPLPPRREPTKPHALMAEQPPAPAPSFPPMPLSAPPPPSAPQQATAAPPASMSTASLAASSMPPPPTSPAPPKPVPTPVAPPPSAPQAPAASTAPAGSAQCPACGYANASSVKFCGNCGKRLDGAAAPAAAGGGGEGQGRTMFMHAADMSQVGKDKICKLITIDQTGREGMTFTIKSGETLCGRVNGIILFFDDPYVSPTHCKFSFLQSKLKVFDQGSLNGVYMRVKGERRLSDGELLRVGRQLFRYESLGNAAFQIKKQEGDDSRIWGSPNPGAFGRLVQILDDGRTGEIRLLSGERCQLGREVGDIVMPTDGFISGRHCVFINQNGETVLTDLGSSNGTYVRVRGEADVGHGDFILVGNQMLRVEIV